MKYTSIFALTLLAAVQALAQNSISWVSRSGNDSNTCIITSPCRTFQRGYNQTNSYGIVKAMDAGEYGPISISKPIIIDGNGVGASIEMLSGNGVTVSAAGPVEILNLSIHASGGYNGIDSANGILSIENVTITGQPVNGVNVSGGTATIHGVVVTTATTAIYVQDASAAISDSVVRYSFEGIVVRGNTAVTQALIERSKIISNTIGLLVANAGTAATARISDCVITVNTTAVSTSGGGQIITFRNNAWAGNGTDGSTPFSISLK